MKIKPVSGRNLNLGTRFSQGVILLAVLFLAVSCAKSKKMEIGAAYLPPPAEIKAVGAAAQVWGNTLKEVSEKGGELPRTSPVDKPAVGFEAMPAVRDLGEPRVQFAAMNAEDKAGEQAPAPAEAKRLVIYTANLGLKVSNITTTRKAIEELVRHFDGFIQRETLKVISFRVRPEHFDAALAEIEKMGEVTERGVSSEDVTEEYFDMSLRVEVAEKSRERLLEVLKGAVQAKDILEIERDIRRLTEEIEGMKGRLRVLQNQIAYATITVTLTERVQDQARPSRRIPAPRFEWIRDIGLDVVLGPVPLEARLEGPNLLSRLLVGKPFQLGVEKKKVAPDGFAVLKYDGEELIASTAEDYRLRVLAMEPRQESELKFWADALASELGDNRGYMVKQPESFDLESKDLKATVLRCETSFGGERWNYEVWLIQRASDPDDMLAVEFARASKDSAKHLKDIEKAVRGIKM
jgi:hypothetical protein